MVDLPEPDAKVLFLVPSNDAGSNEADIETLWAWRLGEDKYKLDNLPYFAYSVSWEDIVYAPFNEDEGFPTFQKVIEKSGNRTIRFFFNNSPAKSHTQDILRELENLGCSYEGANDRFFCLNIPRKADLEAVASYLIEKGIEFEYADPTYEELFPEE
jgi:hypothetical protein